MVKKGYIFQEGVLSNRRLVFAARGLHFYRDSRLYNPFRFIAPVSERIGLRIPTAVINRLLPWCVAEHWPDLR